MGKLFTIGHSVDPAEHLYESLHTYGIDYVLDVRSTPFSRYAPQYNKEALERFLPEHGIRYFHMGKYFGARQPDKALYHPEGYLDFEKVRASALFRTGKASVVKGLSQGHNIALMCTEKRPIDCHRAIMVARGFELDGIEVSHILNNGSLISQEDLNEELLDLYFPDRAQCSLLDPVSDSGEDDLLTEAYRMRNQKIGYRINEAEERMTE